MAPNAGSRSLADCTITITGVHTACPDLAKYRIGELRKLIEDCGGSYVSRVTNDCTHLVASSKQFEANGAKVKDAVSRSDISIVNFDWLVKSLISNAKVKEDPFLLANGNVNGAQASIGAQDNATSNGVNVKKRSWTTAAGAKDDDSAPKAKKVKDGQKVSRSASLHVPLDEHPAIPQSHQVYTDVDGTIFDALLNQTNAGNNNNKFYRIQLLVNLSNDDYRTWTRWGRVGEQGSSKLHADGSLEDALSEFQKRFRDKTGKSWKDRLGPTNPKKYIFLERNYEDSGNENDDDLPGAGKSRASKESLPNDDQDLVESKLAGAVQRLMHLIFNEDNFKRTMTALDYDSNKMPLGKLSKRTLKNGYEILKEIAALVGNVTLAQSQYNTPWEEITETLSNSYLSTIPHSFGRHRPPILRDMNDIRKEIELLEALTDLQLANDIMKAAKVDRAAEVNVLDMQYEGLGMKEITPLEASSNEFKQIHEYLVKSAGATHHLNYNVQDIFRIERRGEDERFTRSKYSGVENSDRRLLWHGSRCTNFGGILSQGLRIAPPEAPASGYMFGKGVYLADISTKSANYCASYTSGNIGLLLLCEAELGKPPLKLTVGDCDAGEKAQKVGSISTWGVGRTAPKGWKDAGCINETLRGVIVPDMTQTPAASGEPEAWLDYNEYIVYDVAQIKLRYLIRTKIG